jgi:branched-chain amino acid transport system permease protein
LPTFRLRGHYFALSMLAYPLAMLYVFEWMGFQEVSLPMKREAPALYVQFNDPRAYMALALVLLVVCMIVSLHVERSRFGMSLTAIKQNEPAASAAGINPLRWKMLALIVSAGMAAAVGGLYAVVLLVVTPQTMFGALVSAEALIIPMFGGIGVFWGPVIGAAVLVPLAETLNAQLGNILPGIQGVVYGVAIILITLLAPEGIYWSIRDRFTSRRAARVPAPSTAGAVAIPTAARPQQFGHPAAAGEALLSLNGISRAFGGLKAVDDVTLSIKAGTIHGIIGPNGAGKTTLFNVINGFLVADTGSIVFAGTELVGLKPHEICRHGVGRTFQVVRAFPRMTVLENVIVGAMSARRAMEAERRMAAQNGLGWRQRPRPSRWLTHQTLRLMGCSRAPAAKVSLLDEMLGLARRARGHCANHPPGQSDGVTVIIGTRSGHDEACWPLQRARSRQADCHRAARQRRQGRRRDRSLSRQEMDGTC